jgi:hypothetical protein
LVKMYSERSHNTNNHHRPKQTDIAEAVAAIAPLFTTVFIIIDALDEHTEDAQQSVIRKILELPFSDCRLFVTSRFVPRIRALFRDYPQIQIEARSEDIRTLIETRIPDMHRLSNQVERYPELKAEIVTHINQRAEGM